MATQGPLRVVIAIVSIVVALVAAFYASLLPGLPAPSQVSKAATAAALWRSRSRSQSGLSNTRVTISSRPPVYFFSHGGVGFEVPSFPFLNAKANVEISQM